jgi:uncharacterized damage-inducible protein DinB
MPTANDNRILEIILESWDRNNRILVNLVRALPPGGLEARAMSGSPSVAEMLTHIHYVRLVFLEEDCPEFAIRVPAEEWSAEASSDRIARDLDASAKAVRDAVKSVIRSDQAMKLHYDHPLLYLQHMIWHEGYHHGQIKLALKINGRPLENEMIGPGTWGIWMHKSSEGRSPGEK